MIINKGFQTANLSTTGIINTVLNPNVKSGCVCVFVVHVDKPFEELVPEFTSLNDGMSIDTPLGEGKLLEFTGVGGNSGAESVVRHELYGCTDRFILLAAQQNDPIHRAREENSGEAKPPAPSASCAMDCSVFEANNCAGRCRFGCHEDWVARVGKGELGLESTFLRCDLDEVSAEFERLYGVKPVVLVTPELEAEMQALKWPYQSRENHSLQSFTLVWDSPQFGLRLPVA